MTSSFIARIAGLATFAVIPLMAQSTGGDVIVGDLTDVLRWGESSGTTAFSIGTISCNVGTQGLSWIAGTNQHPVIAQNLYRLKGGSFEQIGMSWVKHGFYVVPGQLCGTCPNPSYGSPLAVGCSDIYGGYLNGSQSNMGPRSDVNPVTGAFPYPPTSLPWSGILDRRLQVADPDLDPALNQGALYFAEAIYVHPEDAQAGNQHNNATYRPCTVSGSGTTFPVAFTGPAVQTQPAITAWAAVDPGVTIETIDLPSDGRFYVARRSTGLGGGLFHHTFAVFNLDSDRAARAFTVDFPPGVAPSNPGFHDVAYHSGELYAGTDWQATTTVGSVTWSTDSFAQDPHANALRWGTLYTFWCDAPAASAVAVHLQPFKPEPCPTPPTIVHPLEYALDRAAPYTFIDISATGQAGPTGDDGALVVPIGFPFSFFGTTITQIGISTNGYLYVDQPGQDPYAYNNASIPDPAQPNGIIAALWDDLDQSQGGAVKYQLIGSAPARQFIVLWNAVPRLGIPNSAQTFEVILGEDGTILSTIVASPDGGVSATRGVEDLTGTHGVQGSVDTAGGATPHTTWRYTWVTDFLPSASLEALGNGAPNTTFELRVTCAEHGAPVVMLADSQTGVIPVPPFGTIEIPFVTPLVLADGLGVFGPADPLAITDGTCGVFSLAYFTGPAGLPPGLHFWTQAFVAGPLAPNGVFHKTPPIEVSIP